MAELWHLGIKNIKDCFFINNFGRVRITRPFLSINIMSFAILFLVLFAAFPNTLVLNI